MEKIIIKELIDFRRKSNKTRKTTFVKKLKTRKPKEKKVDKQKEKGGDYWTISTSCINKVYKLDDEKLYDLKIEEVTGKIDETEFKNVKSMYLRNINILTNFKDFDFSEIKPKVDIKFENIPKSSKTIIIDNFPIFVNPSNIFSFELEGKKQIGSVWFVTQLGGFRKEELGMFCESLHKFLLKNYGEDYQISEKFCIAIDTFDAQIVTYNDFMNGNIPLLIDSTLKEMNEL